MATRDSVVLALSSVTDVAEWVGGGDEPAEITPTLIGSLEAAREIISSMVDMDRVDTDNLPAALHRAATMKAAQLHLRTESVYGVEAYSLSGDAGGFLSVDPAIRELIAPWRRPSVGVSRLTADTAPTGWLPYP